MIEQWLVTKLGTLEDLAGKVYPVEAPGGETAPPVGVFNHQEETMQPGHLGDVLCYTAKFWVHLFHEDNDALCVLSAQAENAICCRNEDAGDLYIFSADACRGEPAGFDLRLEIHVQTLSVIIIYWR